MFDPAALTAFFTRHAVSSCLLAYSGGLDSHVLLHACARLQADHPRLRFRALHVDHGLQADSAAWAMHCQHICQQLAMPLEIVQLHLRIPAGESLEAVARQARYQVFARHLQTGEMLLTAHHRDDQAETLLLNLLRGSGVDGLAAMPECRDFTPGYLGRPLLPFGRSELLAYAGQHALHYLHDPSNTNPDFDRNFLRQSVLPLLQQRWPEVTTTLARAAQWQQESRVLLHECVQEKMPDLQGSAPGSLAVSALLALDAPLQKAVVRHWLQQAGFMPPSAKKLKHVLQDVLLAKADAQPCVAWPGCEVRRYRDDVFALLPLSLHDVSQCLDWPDPQQPLFIPSLQRWLVLDELGAEARERLQAATQPLTVRFRQGGEKLKLAGQSRELKYWLQDRGVPPWERARLPLVYAGEVLVWVCL
ncbi:MAG: tRNA lysidine(34) synthetase TilS [Thiolinea sp.]